MFRKLHIQLTIFCTAVTGGIFIGLTLLCLIFAQNSIKENYYNSFLMELNTTISHLQDQDIISQRWLGTLASSGSMEIYLYDNGQPLFDPTLQTDPHTTAIVPKILKTAETDYGMNIFPTNAKQLTTHTEFLYPEDLTRGRAKADLVSGRNEESFVSIQYLHRYDSKTYSKPSFYASAGYIPKNGGVLSFLILFKRDAELQQIHHMRMLFLVVDIIAIAILCLFSDWFTRRMIRPLEQAQKKQTLFIASASHELRSPLSVLRSGLEVLRKSKDPVHFAQVINTLFDETIHMEHLVNDMLTLASADSGSLPLRPEPCQPDSILLNVYEKYETLAKQKEIRLTIGLPDEILPDCNWDRERIEQVCSILVDNALSYTPKGGTICLSLSTKDNRIFYHVTDTGCGIPDAEKEAIFDRFYRMEKSRSDKNHFGLGLCIAKENVTAHRGTIDVIDSPNGGSHFRVTLPINA